MNPPKVLIADDDLDNRTIVIDTLRAAGFDVLAAADGLEALRLARDERPDLVLLDLSLPKLDGWETAGRLKADPALSSLPVIAYTAHAMHGDEEKARGAGCDDYVAKPCTPRDLLAVIRKWLDRPAPGRKEAPAPEAGPAGAPPENTAPSGEALSPRGEAGSPGAERPVRILVIDDEKGYRDFYRFVLEPLGYEITTAADGVDGLALAENTEFDIIFLDVHMPKLRGPDVLAAIRERQPGRIVIIFSSSSDPSFAFENQAREKGAFECLFKPVDLDDLLQVIRRALAATGNTNGHHCGQKEFPDTGR